MEVYLKKEFIFKNVYIQYIYVPEIEQYNLVLRLEHRYIEKKLDKITLVKNAMAEKESKTILLEYEKQKYEEIGKLIRKYPEIMNYLKIEKMSSQAQFIYYPVENFWNQYSFLNRFDLSEFEKKNPKKTNEKSNTAENNNYKFLDKTPP